MKKFLRTAVLTTSVMFGASMPVQAQTAPMAFKGNPEDTYYMISFNSGVEYWFPVYEMFKQAGQQLGVKTVYTGPPEYDVNKQIAVFDQVLARNPKGIFIAPMNSDPLIEPINRAHEMGVPVVTFAADSPNSKRLSHITSDNRNEGIWAADVIGEAMGGSGEFAVLENPGQDNHERRITAFLQRMEEKWPNMKLAGRAASYHDSARGYNVLLNLAQANPNLDAVFIPEAVSTIGAAQAAKELGGKIKIVHIDVNEKVLDMIKAGEVYRAINPNQGMQGYMGMIMLFLAANPDMIDPMNADKAEGRNPMAIPYVDNGLTVVTAENADAFYWNKYLARRGTKGIEE